MKSERPLGDGSLLPVAKPVKQKSRKSSRPAKRPTPAAKQTTTRAKPPTLDESIILALSGLAGGPARAKDLQRLFKHRTKLPEVIDGLRRLAAQGFVVQVEEAAESGDTVWKIPNRGTPAGLQPPTLPAWEDTEDGLQLDLEHEVRATIAGLYLFRVLFTNHRLHEVRREHPLTEYHLAGLCTHLAMGLGTAVDQIEVRRMEKRKGGHGE